MLLQGETVLEDTDIEGDAIKHQFTEYGRFFADHSKRIRELEDKVLEIELRRALESKQKLKSVSSTKGAPQEEFSTIRPAYRSRGAKIAEAQRILNEKQHKDVPEKATTDA